MTKLYETPIVELIEIGVDIITSSPIVPDFEEDDTELPKQDW